jgi:hypothetical protein
VKSLMLTFHLEPIFKSINRLSCLVKLPTPCWSSSFRPVPDIPISTKCSYRPKNR